MALIEAAKEAAVQLYAPVADPYFEDLARNGDRVFYLEEGSRQKPRLGAKAHPRVPESKKAVDL